MQRMNSRVAAPESDLQRTLRRAARLSGAGLHSGTECEIVILPAEEDTGIIFVSDGCEVPGLAANVVDTSRSTTLAADGRRITTSEHVMAALRGAGIDNARVEVPQGEAPAMDGSALAYVEAIVDAGVRKQSRNRRTCALRGPARAASGDAYILAEPADELKIRYMMSYAHPMIGEQRVEFLISEAVFRKEIAPARTFVIYEEVADLLSRRLAQGGSLSNTIVVFRDRLSCELRFPDELARHKVLDLIGDLALLGAPLRAEITAFKSGHALNVEFVRHLSEVAVCKGWEGESNA